MSEPIQFKFGITKLFSIAKCVNTPAGHFCILPAAPEDATSVEGSETLVQAPEIMMVTAGSFDLVVPELGTISLQAGDTSSPQRYRGPLRIVSTADDSAYVCLTPRDGAFWQRQTGFVAGGDDIVIETPASEDAFVYVAIGGLLHEGEDCLVDSFRQVPQGETTLIGTQDAHFLHLWR